MPNNLNGFVMMQDKVVAVVEDSIVTDIDRHFAPLYLLRTKDIIGWLESRAIDSHRTNSRLLKKALRLAKKDDLSTVLSVNAVTITDNWWFKQSFEENLCWNDVKFKENIFDGLALRGDPDGFSLNPSRTPELTNTGSFEKCWKLVNGEWWMYKNENENERFSEYFIHNICKKLDFPVALYEIEDNYIKTLDFTRGSQYNYEPISALMDDNEDYEDNFRLLQHLSEENNCDLVSDYLKIIYVDAICYNMDRHTNNYGFFRDINSGKIISMAPNFDNNIALIARNYPKDISRQKDGLIAFFKEFLVSCPEAKEYYKNMDIKILTKTDVLDAVQSLLTAENENYIVDFILNGQDIVQNLINN